MTSQTRNGTIRESLKTTTRPIVLPRSAKLVASDVEVFVQPRQALGRTALLSGVFSLVPVFAALILLTLGTAIWPVVVLAEVFVTSLYFTVYIRFRLVYTAVTSTHFIKRRMLLPPVSVELAKVDRLLVNRVYRTSSTEALLQLLAVNVDCHRLFGMNALFWSEPDIRAVADACGIQTTTDEAPVSRGDYYTEFPVARGWYVRRTALICFTVVAIAALTGAVMYVESWVRAL